MFSIVNDVCSLASVIPWVSRRHRQTTAWGRRTQRFEESAISGKGFDENRCNSKGLLIVVLLQEAPTSTSPGKDGPIRFGAMFLLSKINGKLSILMTRVGTVACVDAGTVARVDVEGILSHI